MNPSMIDNKWRFSDLLQEDEERYISPYENKKWKLNESKSKKEVKEEIKMISSKNKKTIKNRKVSKVKLLDESEIT